MINTKEAIGVFFVNTTQIYQFKAKESEIKRYPLYLGEIWGDFSANNFKKQAKWVFVWFLYW